MPKKNKLPLVAICGRPNVGKSTLFNRLIGKARAIVHDEEGITRDRYYGEAEWDDYHVRMVDTGGMVDEPGDTITRAMQEQVKLAIMEAQVVLFVIDGQQPLTKLDYDARDTVQKSGKPVVLVANKMDNVKLRNNLYEYYELGLGDPIPVSSGHNLGIEGLWDAMALHLPKPEVTNDIDTHLDIDLDSADMDLVETPEEPEVDLVIKIAVIGKPNVGKSSYINAIMNEPRVIVDDTPGTTRDAIDVQFRWKDQDYILIDTAGLRRKAGIKAKVEHYSVSRTLRAVRRADVCLLLMDATEGISEQDKRIMGYVIENGAAMVIVWSKWDLVENKEKRFKALADELEFKMPVVRHMPSITISNETRQRLFKTFEVVDKVARETRKRISTGQLNKFIEVVKAKHNPPSEKGKHAKILYATQASVKPTTFIFFVNQKRLFHFSYMRFLENQLRAAYGFEGVPIKLELREEKQRK